MKHAMRATVKEKLSAFADWFKDEHSWYTRKQLANIVICAESSIGAAVSWLRRNGFIVTSIWVYEERRYLYNIKKGSSDDINKCARRTRQALSKIRQKLRNKIGRL